MKLPKIIRKNLKIIFRNKASALSVVLGPIIVVILVTLAFNRSVSFDISVGLIGNQDLQVYNDLKTSLESNGYETLHFSSLDTCLENINYGVAHVCIVIPEDFNIESGNNTLSFYLDQSRANLFWSVLNSISSVIELESTEISQNIVSDLLTILGNAKTTSLQQIDNIERVKQDLTNLKLTLQSNKESLDNLDLNTVTLDFSSVLSKIDNISSTIDDDITTIIDDLQSTIDDPNASADAVSLATRTKNSLQDLQDNIDSYLSTIRSQVNSLKSQANSLNNKLETAQVAVSSVSEELGNMIQQIDSTLTLLSNIQDELQNTVNEIDSFKIKSSERITNPIVTELHTVASETSQIAYMIPYLLTLFIMMVSVLLASTLVVIDRNSKAYFRTFTTPTKQIYFFLSYYLTSLLLVAIQTGLMILIGYYFVGDIILSNLGVVSIVLFLSATLFILLGIAIGTLIKSQEGVTITSLSLTIMMLLISNFVLPLETMNVNIRKLAYFNPYVISSEIFRRAMFFHSTFLKESNLFLLLIAETLVIVIVTYILHKLSYISYFRKSKFVKSFSNGTSQILKLKDGTVIKNKSELIAYINSLDDQHFKSFVKKNKKDLEKFVRFSLKDEELWNKLKEFKRDF